MKYNNDHRLINVITYNEKHEKQNETKYEYKSKRTIIKHSINHEQLNIDPNYTSTTVIFEIEYYDQ